ncbi:MAG: hypothetical protein ABSA52_11775 [Candidatus Binatia bacterium]
MVTGEVKPVGRIIQDIEEINRVFTRRPQRTYMLIFRHANYDRILDSVD